MGTGASSSKKKTSNKASQMPPIEPKPSQSPVFVPAPKHHPRPKTPHQRDEFDLETNVEDYSSVWDHDTKLSSTFQKTLKSERKPFEQHQKETFNRKSDKKHSTAYDSARIESTIDSHTQGSINLSNSEKLDELIRNLSRIHTELDQSIKTRTEQISHETDSLLSHILGETQEKQRRLLAFAKERQLKQDQTYHRLLEEYISHLDELKAKEFSQLQTELQVYRDQILEESQLKILTVNEQANSIKGRILQHEQEQASEKIDSVTSQIDRLARDDKAHPLSTELTTKTNIFTSANIGSSDLPTKARKSKD